MDTALDFLIAARRGEIRELEQLTLACELVRRVAVLVHRLQGERGSSQIVLASSGRRFGAQWSEAVGHSDAALDPVRAWVDHLDTATPAPGSARLYTRIAVALHALGTLPALRTRVRAQACSAGESVRAYTEIINALLGLVFEAADVSVDPAIARPLVALFNLMQGKEYAGQERAAGAAAFAAGTLDEADRHALALLRELQEQCFARFEAFCAPEVMREWQALRALIPVGPIARLRERLAAGTPHLRLDPEEADAWFAHCSTRHDLIHQAETHLAERLRRGCGALIAARAAELRDEQALRAALPTASGPVGALALIVDPAPPNMDRARPRRDPAQPNLDRAPADIDHERPPGAAMGPKLARSVVDSLQAQVERVAAMSAELAAIRSALDERKLVERAKGLLMQQRRLGEGEAYAWLRRQAMDEGLRLAEVAQRVLDAAPPLRAHAP